jgi:hypothetical protein
MHASALYVNIISINQNLMCFNSKPFWFTRTLLMAYPRHKLAYSQNMKPYTLDESRTIINISTACRTEKGK